MKRFQKTLDFFNLRKYIYLAGSGRFTRPFFDQWLDERDQNDQNEVMIIQPSEAELVEISSFSRKELIQTFFACVENDTLRTSIQQDYYDSHAWFACSHAMDSVVDEFFKGTSTTLREQTRGIMFLHQRLPTEQKYYFSEETRTMMEILVSLQEYFTLYYKDLFGSDDLTSQDGQTILGFRAQLLDSIKANPDLPLTKFNFNFHIEDDKIQKEEPYSLYNVTASTIGIQEVLKFVDDQAQKIDNVTPYWPGGLSKIPSIDIFSVKVLYLIRESGPLIHYGFFKFVDMVENKDQDLQIDLTNKLLVSELRYTTFDGPAGAQSLLKDVNPNEYAIIIGDLSSGQSLDLLEYFQDAKITVPVISTISTAVALSSAAKFPQFVRTPQDDSLQWSALGVIMKVFNWKSMCVGYADSPYGIGFHDALVESRTEGGFEILNPPSFRIFKTSQLKLESRKDAVEALSVMRDSRCTIFVYFGLTEFVFDVLKVQHDLGMYGKGFVQLATEWLGSWSLEGNGDDPQHYKTVKVLEGAIGTLPPDIVGDYGKLIQAKILGSYGKSSNFSFYSFDAGLLLGHTILHMNRFGKNFNDHEEFAVEIRNQKFVGATGEFSFIGGQNNRKSIGFRVYNVIKNKGQVQIGDYHPAKARLFVLTGDPIWPGGESEVPAASNNNGCPFYDSEAEIRPFSRLDLPVMSLISIFVLFFSMHSLVLRKPYRYPLLKKPVRIQPLDFGVMLSMVVEMLVLTSLSPSFGIADEHTKNSVVIDPEMAQWRYEFHIVVSLVVAIMFIAFRIFWYIRRCTLPSDQQFQESSASAFYNFVIGNIVFFYIFKNLFSINACSIKVEWNQETYYYLRQDCQISCDSEEWQKVVTLCNIVMLLFLVSGCDYRMNFQDTENGALNIEQSKAVLGLKCVIYTAMTVCDELLKGQVLLHLGIFLFMLLIPLIYCKSSPTDFNSPGPRTFQMATYLCVLAEVCVSTIVNYTNPENSTLIWMAATLTLWFIIMARAVARMASGFKIITFTYAEENSEYLYQKYFRSGTISLKDIVPNLRRREDFANSRKSGQPMSLNVSYDSAVSNIVNLSEMDQPRIVDSENELPPGNKNNLEISLSRDVTAVRKMSSLISGRNPENLPRRGSITTVDEADGEIQIEIPIQITRAVTVPRVPRNARKTGN
eukprot:CAMPEP_0114987700 /NCGR_PEP_ID=MMETSP0216-20121206/9163_1 /TAXON_ID=223996 /ORGANISM="Protocruzia adherens, Strain Boccale" /LENGTH=1163 /DNA_ID=CAMNT_0002350347 /DNA_START=375 /DNA_END=3866 /DNA_ORIENTATION=+